MKKNQYKLLINNQQKKIIKEADYSLEDTSKFIEDMFSIGTNLIKATVITLGAHWEHAVFATEVVGFASIENINKHFLEKIEAAEKLYDAAVPDAVKTDVNFLFNVNNPAIFMGKKIFETVTDTKTIELYVPFSWAIKYIFSGNFFKNDVKDFGQLFTGMKDLRVNNIIWYWGWFFRKVILNNIEDLQKAIDNGFLSRLGIQKFKKIKNMNDLLNEYPNVIIFLRGVKAFETLTKPVTEFYDFCNRWKGEKFARIISLHYYISEKSGNKIRLRYNDLNQKIKDNTDLLSKEKDASLHAKIQKDLESYQAELAEIENISTIDPQDKSTFGIKDIVEDDKENEINDIKVIGDAKNPNKTAIEQQIEDVENEIKTTTDDQKKNELQKKLQRLNTWKEYLKNKYSSKYGDVNDQSLIQKAQQTGKKPIDLIKERHQRIERRMAALIQKIDTGVDNSGTPTGNILSKKLEDERKQLFDEFMEDFKRTSARVFKAEFDLLPDMAKLLLGDELGTQFQKDFSEETGKVYNLIGGVLGQERKKLEQYIQKTLGVPVNLPNPGALFSPQLTINNINHATKAITLSWNQIATGKIVYANNPGFTTPKDTPFSGINTFIINVPAADTYHIKIVELDAVGNPTGTESTTEIAVVNAGGGGGLMKPTLKVTPKTKGKNVDVEITNFVAAAYAATATAEYELTITPPGGAPPFIKKKIVSPIKQVESLNMVQVGKSRAIVNSNISVKVTITDGSNTVNETDASQKVIFGRPKVFEYVLKIENDKKVIVEAAMQVVDDFETQIYGLEKMGMNVTEPNKAEEIILKNILNSKKINNTTRQWLEASKVIKQSNGNLPDNKAKILFNNMLDISTKVFTKLQFDIMKGIEEINDEKSEQAQQINKELKKEFGIDLTPKNMAEQASFNFNLLCEIYRLYAVVYLTNIKIILDENQIIVNLLKNQPVKELLDLLGQLKNRSELDIKTILSDEVGKKFEKTNRELLKYFGKETQTYADFVKQKDGLFDMIRRTQNNLSKFYEDIDKTLENIKRLPEKKKLELLVESIDEYIKNNEKNVEIVYNKFLPGLQKLKQNFINLSQTRDKLMKNYSLLLQEMDDEKNFQTVYKDNYDKFNKAYEECTQNIGNSNEGLLLKSLSEIKTLKKQYEEKIKSGDFTETREMIPVKKKTKNKKSDESATLKINNGSQEIINSTSPIEIK